MPIMNYTTKVPVSRTVDEVHRLLSRRGISRIATTLDDSGNPSGMSFSLVTPYGVREFELPVRIDGVLRALNDDPNVPRPLRTRQQAERVGWRIAADWLKAQWALVDANLSTMDEVMFPFMVNERGDTAYAVYRAGALDALGA